MYTDELDVEKKDLGVFPYKLYGLASAVMTSCFLLLGLFFLAGSPIAKESNVTVTIPTGAGAQEVSDLLAQNEVVRSGTLLYLSLLLLAEPEAIKAGRYTFTANDSVFDVARLITGVAPPGEVVAITFPEGFSSREYATIVAGSALAFDVDLFHTLARPHEGYLFPDTYYVPLDYTAEELIELILTTYDKKTEGLVFTMPEYESLVLASIVEREANTPQSMKMVAGVFRNRLEIGMPLQADASIEYILDKPLNQLTPADLRIDSPYNTYLNSGLPPTPIGNPGLTSLEAVQAPAMHNYFYYITGNNGEFYYATTLVEHNENIARYLQ